jgi:hypothetical protein
MNVKTGAQLWGGQFNRGVEEVLARQDDLSSEIAGKLRLKLTGDDKQRLVKRYREDSEAYQFLFEGTILLEQTELGRDIESSQLFPASYWQRPRLCAGLRGFGRRIYLPFVFQCGSPAPGNAQCEGRRDEGAGDR